MAPSKKKKMSKAGTFSFVLSSFAVTGVMAGVLIVSQPKLQMGGLRAQTDQLMHQCGNAIVEQGEQCDDGNKTESDDCTSECRFGRKDCPQELREVCGAADHCENGMKRPGARCVVPIYGIDYCGEGARDCWRMPACIWEYSHTCSAAIEPDTRDGTTADLAIISISAQGNVVGSPTTYTVTIRNNGPARATHIKLYKGFGQEVTFVAAGSSPGCAWIGGGLQCTLATLQTGTEHAFTIIVKTRDSLACDAGMSTAATVVLSGMIDPVPGNNSKQHGHPFSCQRLCGNGIRDEREQCDDGNVTPGDGCSASCSVEPGYTCTGQPSVCTRPPVCGNGFMEGSEQCDDGNRTNLDGCSSACAIERGYACNGQPSVCATVCGDGVKAGTERCDDGPLNGTPNRCDTDCMGPTPSVCGNGIRESNELCDDGNTTASDGCSDTCRIEAGFYCTGQPSVCTRPICGNGIVEPGEGCDDGNAVGRDGCSSLCVIEPEFYCTGQPSVCKRPVCGNGIHEPGELCDDGNSMKWDGCTRCKRDDPSCKPVDLSNDMSADAVNVVFRVSGIPNASIPSIAQQYAASIRSLQPFSTNGKKIQFWYAPQAYTGVGVGPLCHTFCRETVFTPTCAALGSRYNAYLCNSNCRSSGYLGGDTFTALADPTESGTRIFKHEFGHQFGWLMDEYDEAGRGSYHGVNCAPNLATVQAATPSSPYYLWKSLLGASQNFGCSYVRNNVYPQWGTIMRYTTGNDYGIVGIAAILKRLQVFRGNPEYFGQVPASPGKSMLAQLSEVTPSSEPEPALRITLVRQADDTFAIEHREVIEQPHGVKPSFEQGNVLSVNMDGREFTQTFMSDDVLISEEAHPDGSFHNAEMTVTPLNEIVVEVGMGKTLLVDAETARLENGDFVPMDITITPCDSLDENLDNDCPPPMFRGKAMSYELSPDMMATLKAEATTTPHAGPETSSPSLLAWMPIAIASFVGFIVVLGGLLWFVQMRRT